MCQRFSYRAGGVEELPVTPLSKFRTYNTHRCLGAKPFCLSFCRVCGFTLSYETPISAMHILYSIAWLGMQQLIRALCETGVLAPVCNGSTTVRRVHERYKGLEFRGDFWWVLVYIHVYSARHVTESAQRIRFYSAIHLNYSGTQRCNQGGVIPREKCGVLQNNLHFEI